MRHAAGFLDSVLRGVGQVMLQDNAWTGLLFLIGIFINHWVWGLYAVLGAACATAAALAWGAPEHDVRHGLYGFNGTLTALALGVYLRPGAALLAYIVLGAVASSLIMAAIARASGGRALTAPFVLTTWVFVGGIGLFSHMHAAAALAPPHLWTAGGAGSAALGAAGAAAGILNGVAQVMLQRNLWTGAIFLAALAVNSRRACAAAALGSAIALGTGWVLGAAPEALRSGLFGFNAVLTAIAVGSLYFPPRRATVLLALLAVFVSTLLYAAMVVVFAPLGLPVVTAPFVLTTWLCLLAQGPWSRLRAPAAPPRRGGARRIIPAMRLSPRWAEIAAAGCLLTLALVAALQLDLQGPPAPLGVDAPAEAFSSARAAALLAAWDTAPHPLGTAAHARVRDAILAQLHTLGLRGTVEAGTSYLPLRGPRFAAGYVENITAALPGTAPGGRAVLLVAHYDSVPRGVGAGDDGAGAAALLETLRALRAGPTLRHDVIVLFSDGEEAGLLGAARFVARNRLAPRVAVVLNFEGRGNAGSTAMFETSRHNGWLVRELAAAHTGALADSLMYAIYERLPNDTDLSVFKQAGMPGLNFAYTQGFDYYHSPLDTPERLSPRALQSQGAAMLAMVRTLANADLSHPRAPDVVYFNPLGHALVMYSFNDMNLLALLAMVLFVAACVAGLKRRACTWRALLAGSGIGLLVLAACVLTAPLIWRLMQGLHPGWNWIPQGQPYRPLLPGLALLAWGLLIASALYVALGRNVQEAGLALGALFWWLVAGVGLVVMLPGSAHGFLWPLLALLIAWLVIMFRPGTGGRAAFRESGVLWLGALPMALLLAPFAWALLLLLPWPQSGAALGVLALALLAVAPYLVRLGWRLPVVAAGLCIVLGAAGIARNRFTPDRARPDSIAYVETLGGAAPAALWVSYDPAPDVFTRQFLGAHPDTRAGQLRAPAPVLPLAGPQARVLSDTTSAGLRRLRLQLSSPSGAQQLRLALDGHLIPLAASLEGDPVRLDAPSARYPADAHSWGFTYSGLPAGGVELDFTLHAGQSVGFTLTATRYGLPAIPGMDPRPRPATLISSPFVTTDSTVVSAHYRF